MAEDARQCDGGSGGQGRRRQWLEQAIFFRGDRISGREQAAPKNYAIIYPAPLHGAEDVTYTIAVERLDWKEWSERIEHNNRTGRILPFLLLFFFFSFFSEFIFLAISSTSLGLNSASMVSTMLAIAVDSPGASLGLLQPRRSLFLFPLPRAGSAPLPEP